MTSPAEPTLARPGPPGPDGGGDPFPTLDALQEAHGRLLDRAPAADLAGTSAAAADPTPLPDIRAFIDRAQATGAVLERHRDRWAAQSLIDYWATVLYRANDAGPPARLAPYDPSRRAVRPLTDADFPYRRLVPAGAGEGKPLFGRQADVDRCLALLEKASPPLLVVTGPPGSGASTVVRDGVLLALRAGNRVKGSAGWHVLPVATPGDKPLAAFPGGVGGRGKGRAAADRVVQAVRAVAGGKPAGVVIDQLEELFTRGGSDDDRKAFAAAVRALVKAPAPAVRVILVVGSPDLPAAAKLLGEDLVRGPAVHEVRPPGVAELREAIEGPARAAGLTFEPGLAERIAAQVVAHPAPFPLLLFVLAKMWPPRAGNRLTEAEYHAVGGQAAVDFAAEAAYGGLDPAGRRACERLMLRLVRPGAGDRDLVVAALPAAELTGHPDDRPAERAASGVALAALAAAGVLVADGDGRVGVVHDGLIGQWRRLRGWLAEERKQAGDRGLVAKAARVWADGGEREADLLQGQLLRRAADLRDLPPDEERFVKASLAAELARARRYRRAVLLGSTAAVLGLAAISVLLVLYLRASVRAERQATSRMLAARADLQVGTRPDLAMLLGLEAIDLPSRRQWWAEERWAGRFDAPAEAHASLFRAVEANPRLRMYLADPGGHGEPLFAAAYLPDGRVATAGAEGRVLLWDPGKPTGGQVTVLRPGGSAVRSLAVAPDGRRVAAGTADGRLLLWASADGVGWTAADPADALPGVTDPGRRVVRSLAFSPDGRRLASGGWDGAVRVWAVPDAGPPRVLHTLADDPDLGDSVTAVTFRPARPGPGYVLAAAGTGGQKFFRSVVLWDLPADGPPAGRQPLEGAHADFVTALAFNPDGTRLASGDGTGRWQVWDARTGEAVVSADGTWFTGAAPVTALAFAPDPADPTLAVAAADGTVRLYDGRTGARTGAPLGVHRGPVWAVGFGPAGGNGPTLATAGEDGTALLWALRGRRPLFGPTSIGHGAAVVAVALRPDGRRLATAGDDRRLLLWDTDRLDTAPVVLGEYAEKVFDVAFSPDGGRLAAAGGDGRVYLWEVPAGGPPAGPRVAEPRHQGDRRIAALAFGPDGKRLVTCSATDPRPLLWDADRLEVVARLTPPFGEGPGGHVSVGFGGGLVAAAGGDGRLRLWDVAGPGGPDPVAPGWSPGYGVRSVAVAPDGRRLATGGTDGRVDLWNRAEAGFTRNPTARDGHSPGEPVRKLAFDPSGRWLGSAGYDFRVGLWDAEAGTGRLTGGHRDTVLGVSLAGPGADGAVRLATGSRDKTARLWSAPVGPKGAGMMNGRPLPQGGVQAVAFCPAGGPLLAAAMDDGRVILWDVAARRTAWPPLRTAADQGSGLAFDPPGRRLATGRRPVPGDPRRGVSVWDLTAGPDQVPVDLLFPNNWSGVAVSLSFGPGGKYLAAGNDFGQAVVWDVAAGRVVGRVADDPAGPAEAGPYQTAQRLGLGDSSVARRIDLRVATDPQFSGRTVVAFHPADGRLAVTRSDNSVRLYDVPDLRPAGRPLVGSHDRVRALAFSPDGGVLAAGGRDARLRLWRVGDREADPPRPVVLRENAGTVEAVAFAPKGDRLVASAGRPGEDILLWDPATQLLYGRINPGTGPTAGVTGLAFDPQGELLAWGTGDGAVWLAEIGPGSVKARARKVVNRPLTDDERERFVVPKSFP